MSGNFDYEFVEPVAKGIVYHNRRDVFELALEQRNHYLLTSICGVAGSEGRIDLLDEVWSNVDNNTENVRDFFRDDLVFVDTGENASCHGKLDVLKWLDVKGLLNDEEECSEKAACCGQLHILEWLQEVPWGKLTFIEAVWRGNLIVLQWLHDEGCP